MRPIFPECSRKVVEKLNEENKGAEIVAEFVPDDEYNPQTIKTKVNHNGGNREVTPEEMAYNEKYGTVDPQPQ